MTKDVQVAVRMSKDLREALRKAAAAEDRTVSSLIVSTLSERMRQNGLLDKPQAAARKASK